MGKLRFGASMLGVFLMKMTAVLAGQTFIGATGNDPRTEADEVNDGGSNITSENSVKDAHIRGGEEIIAGGDEFLIQGEFPDFPTPGLETNKTFDRLPTPQVFVPPSQPETYPE
jgi:hypothetical protein